MGSGTKSKRKDKGKKSKGSKSLRKKDRKLNAKNADRFDLYQRAVNSPETDVDFLTRTFKELRGRELRHLREDFCGTANLCAEFLGRDEQNTAEGFDLDPEPMEWGRKHNFTSLGEGAERMNWHLADVRSKSDRPPEVTTAANFSYWCFHTRKEMLEYFAHIREDLADDGLFVLDLYGGPEAYTEMEEIRDVDGGAFEYVWDQRGWEPGTGKYEAAIHFRFRDGSEMRDAFTYSWRFWYLTELRDVLLEVGFQRVSSYFEGDDPDDDEEGDGEFVFDPIGDNCDAWIGYLVAEK